MHFKKHISFILSFLILAANMGLALNVHYCHGQVSEVSFTYKLQASANSHHAEKSTCCAAIHKNHKPCCKNDLVKLKDKADELMIVKSFQLELSGYNFAAEWKPIDFYNAVIITAAESP